MPIPNAPGVARLEAIFKLAGEPVENTFHYTTSGGWDDTKLTTLATTYKNWFIAHPGIFSTSCVLTELRAIDLTSHTGPGVAVAVSPPVGGGGTANICPVNVTLAIKRQTGVRGRRNRGRIYHPGIGTDVITGVNIVVSTAIPGFVNGYNTLLSAMNTAGFTEVILHRSDGTSTPVTDYLVVDEVVDSQRRRLPGHNRHN